MTFGVSKIEHSDQQFLKEGQSSPPSKIERIWQFVYECIIKEFASCLRHTWYRLVYWIDPHRHGLNPTHIEEVKSNQIAKVVLLLHGSGAHESSFIPMAKELSRRNIKHIYTASLKQKDENPIPICQAAARVNIIAEKYVKKGYKDVEVAIVGHSLGALVGSKLIWRGSDLINQAKISMLISIAGRLKYIPNKFSWFCQGVVPEINETYAEISKNPSKADLYTIWGGKDAIVPNESCHINESMGMCTVKGRGHGGIVFAPDTHHRVADWVEKWVL